jgi:hypothetical protein
MRGSFFGIYKQDSVIMYSAQEPPCKFPIYTELYMCLAPMKRAPVQVIGDHFDNACMVM